MYRSLRWWLWESVLLLVVMAGCSGLRGWKQGEPIALPAEAVEFSDLRLVIDRQGDELSFKVRCKDVAEYTELSVEVRSDGAVESASYANAVHAEGETLICEPGAVLLEGQAPVFERLETGDRLWVRLEFHRPDGYGAAKEHLYMMGTDGRLRDGGGSVWK
ncbi:MAG: hypothetical protein ACP5HM_02895 [Anaerolineae bacterium]